MFAIGDSGYPFHCQSDAAEPLAECIASMRADRLLIVSDERVFAAHGGRLFASISTPSLHINVPRGERAKSFEVLESVCEQALQGGITRRSVVVAFGGGTIGNLAGLAAALMYRGIRFVHVPTTPVAAFDSVFSLKQAINTSKGKNVIGTYHRPEAVFVDMKTFATLDDRDLRAGVCETIKNVVAIMPDSASHMRELITPTVRRDPDALAEVMKFSIACKARVMASDPREQTEAVILEYGHTVGHGLEVVDFEHRRESALRHGEAVAIGMDVAATVASALCGGDDVRALQNDLFLSAGVSILMPEHIAVDRILQAVASDNKRGKLECSDSEVPMVLLSAPGCPLRTDGVPLWRVPKSLLADALRQTIGR